MEDNLTMVVKKCKALSDANRLQILYLLKKGELCGCELLTLLEIGQSTLSHHMRILVEADMVVARKEGKWSHYSIHKQGLALLEAYIKGMQG